MPQNHIHLSKQTAGSFRTQEWIVRASAEDRRDWLRDTPVCRALVRRGISHAGVAHAAYPYEVTRPSLSGMFVMACVDGAGEVLLDNRWRRFSAGQACLAPPYAPNAYRCISGCRWEFVWVRYVQPPSRRPIVFAAAPLLAAFDGEALRAAVLGLHHEAASVALPAALDQWVDLIETYVRRFTQPWREDDRLHHLWEDVAADLARHWTVNELAARAGLSDEQLRRLCLRTLGRSPRQQLTWMRMERAGAQIAVGTEKLETIAREVGYDSVFSFSNTFHRLLGCRPSEYRCGTGRGSAKT
ncbi:MAG TPA: helix-turn-helix transcriptional regulator [Candidatus Limnocylindria bacterium]|nr:helix-turn-helix transcriptional regulator [Candidatus Limnocylindria bacterium]